MRIGDFQPIDLLFPEQGDRVDEGDTVDCRVVEFDLLLEVDKLLHEAVLCRHISAWMFADKEKSVGCSFFS